MNHDLVEMFREKLDSFTISDYHGLNSPGLTCYLNSVVQVLFMTQDFREAVKRCSKDSTTIDPQLGRLFADLQRSMAETHDVINKLGITNVYEQRDAAEYFERILCQTSPEAAKIFKGELNHKTECLKCKERNDSRSSFWFLPLVVEDLHCQTYSVEEGLKAFFKGEKVCGDNKMFCNQCNKKRDADFGCEITHNPEILTLLLKRFNFDYKRRCYVKLHCNVDVPQTLHIRNCKYDLYAIINHFGNLTGGHYTAHIKSFETHVWYDFNDDIVKRVKQPLRSYAYLLMYRKVSKDPDKTDQGNQEALCLHSDVEAEIRHDEAERGDALVPHHQMKDESCNGGGNIKHLNDNILKKICTDTVWKKPINLSGELEKQPSQRATCARTHKENVLYTDTGADGDSLQRKRSDFAKLKEDGGPKSHEPIRQQLDTNSEEHMWNPNTRRTPTTHQLGRMLEQKHSSPNKRLKGNETIQETQNNFVAETGTSLTDSTRNGIKPNSFHVSSNGYSSSLVPYLTGHLQGQFKIKEPTEYNYLPNLCRKPNSSKRDEERMHHAVTADRSCKPETKLTVKKAKGGVQDDRPVKDQYRYGGLSGSHTITAGDEVRARLQALRSGTGPDGGTCVDPLHLREGGGLAVLEELEVVVDAAVIVAAVRAWSCTFPHHQTLPAELVEITGTLTVLKSQYSVAARRAMFSSKYCISSAVSTASLRTSWRGGSAADLHRQDAGWKLRAADWIWNPAHVCHPHGGEGSWRVDRLTETTISSCCCLHILKL
ncbi:ubiquitin carboxyl-terminal hydrolase 17-like protein A isoform X2 [Perca fluviatilis]|uniref:ubiquitin carboxyl-terminal hydrolase 17-like protein A isoform X2 n=1 Tax=Perca fluviatilis TaxID=8168 RepID=UPI001963B89B|nr:ubiquitin carboxyl-terminal hydrolase 17-like protein A isoform X2 [Perca fluviatilis]